MDTVELDPSTLVRLTVRDRDKEREKEREERDHILCTLYIQALAGLSKVKTTLNSIIISRLVSRSEGTGPIARYMYIYILYTLYLTF